MESCECLSFDLVNIMSMMSVIYTEHIGEIVYLQYLPTSVCMVTYKIVDICEFFGQNFRFSKSDSSGA